MGCFSFICKECGKPILSNSFTGQKTWLFLLREGHVVEKMEGEYDSYGGVFAPDSSSSVKWTMPWSRFDAGEEEEHVCSLMFSKNLQNGIAAVHSKCFKGEIPTTRSEDDPNQGWGEDSELLANADLIRDLG